MSIERLEVRRITLKLPLACRQLPSDNYIVEFLSSAYAISVKIKNEVHDVCRQIYIGKNGRSSGVIENADYYAQGVYETMHSVFFFISIIGRIELNSSDMEQEAADILTLHHLVVNAEMLNTRQDEGEDLKPISSDVLARLDT